MDSSHLHRRPRKLRRTGRHATPSQAEKVAGKAGKAAPAVAIAGALVALPQSAHAEVKTPGKATTVTEQAHTAALVTAKAVTRTYAVRPGDTLRVRATVAESRRSLSKPDRGIIKTVVEAVNTSGQTVMRATAINFVLVRPGT